MPTEFRRSLKQPLFGSRLVRILCIAVIFFGFAACLSNYFGSGATLSSVALAQDDGDIEGGGDEGGAGQAAGGGADDGGAATPDQPSRSYLAYLVLSLGPIFAPVFLILSIAAVSYVVVNLLAIRRNVLMPPGLTEEFTAMLDEKKYQEAYELAKGSESFLGKVLAAGLAKVGSGYESSQQAMQSVGEEEVMRLEHRLAILALLANVAPMIGLLGTVVGMVASFQVIAQSQTAPQASKLAEGISMALVTTEFGLVIAIPCIMAYDILKNMMARMVLEISVVTENLMSRFKTGAADAPK